MSSDIIEIQQRLGAIAAKIVPGAATAANVTRLSGGASQETWAFDIGDAGFILRRTPGGETPKAEHALSLEDEAAVISAASKAGAPAPAVVYVCSREDGLGSAFIMRRMSGETIARKILRDDAYADARPKLAAQCGRALAKIHRTPLSDVAHLQTSDGLRQIDEYEAIYRRFRPRPIFELAFRYLRDRAPPPPKPTLVHGDFRNGNLMIGEDGLRGVLDWELAHIGDPREDLGWICVNSWRFGETEAPVGGFGRREDLLEGYHDGGGARFSVEEIRYWEMLGTLKWGVMCLIMYERFSIGGDATVERAAIGRRASETEMDLINLFQEAEAGRA